MKFQCKWMELESVIMSEVTQSQKNAHGMHSLMFWDVIPKVQNKQVTIHRPQEEADKKEDLIEGALVPLRKGTKYSQEQ